MVQKFPKLHFNLVIYLNLFIVLLLHSQSHGAEETTNLNTENPLLSPSPPLTWQENWTGHRQLLTRAYLNRETYVAVYFDPIVSRNATWIFEFVSSVWNYTTATYGAIGPDPYLYLVLHGGGNYRGPQWGYSLDPNNVHGGRNVLDVASLRANPWLSPTSDLKEHNMDLLTNYLGYFVERSSKNRLWSPTESTWMQKSQPDGNDNAWFEIFTYDVYTNLKWTSQALRYSTVKMRKSVNYPKDFTYWFRDWFMPIYTKYGGSDVLNRYFELLQQELPFHQSVYYMKHHLNMGEFVHFWSGAARFDLRKLAGKAFGWNATYDDQLSEAKSDYSNVTELYFLAAAAAVTSTTLNPDPTSSIPPMSSQITPRPVHETTDADGNIHQANKKTQKYLIISLAVAIPLIVMICLIFIISVIFYRRKIQYLQLEIRALTNEEMAAFFDGDPHANLEKEAQALVMSLPFVRDFEVSRGQIVPAPEKGPIGSGQFGSVIHGFVRRSNGSILEGVALKMVKPNVDVAYFKAFLSEVKIMAFLGHHDNIVRLVATCTSNIRNGEIFIALELCPRGNLLDYLKKNRINFCSIRDSPETVTMFDLLQWSQEICNAMIYLTEKKVIHGDMAARNVLLTENRTAKISDFGLSRQFLNYANYVKTSTTPVPWRWLAIEALKDMQFSTASDVWAFGVTLWEIFSLGETPYGALPFDLFFADTLIKGERLLIPTYANHRIYSLMHECWQTEPRDRPSFEIIHGILGEFISKLCIPQSLQMREAANEAGAGDESDKDFDLYSPPVTPLEGECESLL